MCAGRIFARPDRHYVLQRKFGLGPGRHALPPRPPRKPSSRPCRPSWALHRLPMEGRYCGLTLPVYQGSFVERSAAASLLHAALYFTTPPVELVYQADGVTRRAHQSQHFLNHPSERTWGTMIGRPRRTAAGCPNKCVLQGDDEIQLRFEPFEV